MLPILAVKGKKVHLKTVVTRKQSTAKFPKNEYLLLPGTHAHVRFLENLPYFVFF